LGFTLALGCAAPPTTAPIGPCDCWIDDACVASVGLAVELSGGEFAYTAPNQRQLSVNGQPLRLPMSNRDPASCPKEEQTPAQIYRGLRSQSLRLQAEQQSLCGTPRTNDLKVLAFCDAIETLAAVRSGRNEDSVFHAQRAERRLRAIGEHAYANDVLNITVHSRIMLGLFDHVAEYLVGRTRHASGSHRIGYLNNLGDVLHRTERAKRQLPRPADWTGPWTAVGVLETAWAESAGTETPERAQLGITLAEVLMDRGDAVGAEAWLDRVPEGLGDEQVLVWLRSRALVANGRAQQANEMLKQVNRDALDPLLAANLDAVQATVLAESGSTEAAVAFLQASRNARLARPQPQLTQYQRAQWVDAVAEQTELEIRFLLDTGAWNQAFELFRTQRRWNLLALSMGSREVEELSRHPLPPHLENAVVAGVLPHGDRLDVFLWDGSLRVHRDLPVDELPALLDEASRGRDHLRVLPWGTARDIAFHTLLADGTPLGQKLPVVIGLDLPKTTSVPGPSVVIADPQMNLRLAMEEGAWVASRDKAELLQMSQATRDRAVDAITRASHLHIAAHAVAIDDGFHSELRLADTPLLAEDLLQLVRVPNTVFLNTCDGAISPAGRVERIGLAQAFLAAGTQMVLGTNVKADDQIAFDVARAYYAAPGAPPERLLHVRRIMGNKADPWLLLVR